MKIIDSKSCSPRTAVAYARYSSAGQRDVSIEQQLRDIRAFAEREGYTIVHEYADHARSGFKNISARSEFQAMIAAAGKGSYDTIICWKVDRFGRNREDAAIYKGQLSRLGVSVVYAMEPIPAGAAGVLTEGMLEAIAEWYSRNLSENVRRGMADNARKCLYNGTTVYGYDGIRNQRYQINEEQAAVVRQIYHLYTEGYSIADVCRILNDAGQRTESGKLFTINKLYNIIRSERYIGTYIFGEYRIRDGMPAIIDKSTWELAQRMREKTGRHYEKNPVDYLLTGKAFCGHCGKPMIGDSGTSKTGAVHYYYTCQSKKRRAGCSKKSVKKEYLESVVVNFLLRDVLSSDMIQQIADKVMECQNKLVESSPVRSMEKSLRETERKISNVNRAIAEGVFTSSTLDMLKDLENTASKLRLSIESRKYAEGQLADRQFVVFWLERFSKLKPDNSRDRKFLISTFLNSVYVYDDHLRIQINTSDDIVRISLEDLPPGDPASSDSICSVLLNETHPNSLVLSFRVAM